MSGEGKYLHNNNNNNNNGDDVNNNNIYNIYNNSTYSNTNKLSFYCAGILPYQVNENGEVCLLLGQDENNKWSDFGGKSEIYDGYNTKVTAIREFFEET